MFQIGAFLLACYLGWVGIWGIMEGDKRTKTPKGVAIACIILAFILLIAAIAGPQWLHEYVFNS